MRKINQPTYFNHDAIDYDFICYQPPSTFKFKISNTSSPLFIKPKSIYMGNQNQTTILNNNDKEPSRESIHNKVDAAPDIASNNLIVPPEETEKR